MFDFPGRLRQAREAVGWTSYRLAKEAGLTQQGAVNLERPGADPKLSTLFKLSEALGVSLLQLTGGGAGAEEGEEAMSVEERGEDYTDPQRTKTLLGVLKGLGFDDDDFASMHHFERRETIASHLRYCDTVSRFRPDGNNARLQQKLEEALKKRK